MSYINEILAFQGFVQDKSLSSGQIALWYALMYINNKCQWQEWFTVANKSLESNSGLTRQGIAYARNILKQHGLIDFKSRGTKATLYKMIPMSQSVSDSLQVSLQTSLQGSLQDTLQGSLQTSCTLNRQDKNRQEKNNDTPSISPSIEFYEQNIGPISRTIAEDMQAFMQLGVEEDVIVEAIRRSVDNNKRKWSYTKGILRNLTNQGIKTIKEWKQLDSRNDTTDCVSRGTSAISGDIKLRIPNEC